MYRSAYLDPSLPLPSRATGTRVVTTPSNLAPTDAESVTADATAGDLRIELPAAATYPGLIFVVTHQGEWVTSIVDADSNVIGEMQVDGRVFVLESDGNDWAVRTDGVTNATERPPQLRIWDFDQGKLRQATSFQDAIDSIHALLGSVIATMKEQGADIPLELEDFHVSTGR